MAKVIKNNRLIKKTILRSYLPNFLIALVFNLNWLVDIVLASTLMAEDFSFYVGVLGTNAAATVASIGVAFPIVALATSFLLAFVQGTSIRYNDALARGYKGECSKIFSQGFWTVLLFGLGFSIINFFLADFIVPIFGAEDNILIYYSTLYLRLSGIGFTFASLNRLYVNTLGLYGSRKTIFISNVINVTLNICFSILFYKLFAKVEMPFLFPYGVKEGFKLTLGIGALALGTCVAELITFIFNVFAKRSFKIDARLQFVKPSFKTLVNQFVKGFPVVASIFIESLIAGLVNIIILTANCWNGTLTSTSALTIYTVVRSFWQLAQVSAQAMGLSTIPMVGLFMGVKDKEAVKHIWKNGLSSGCLFTIIWALMLIALSPLMLMAYGSWIEGLSNYIDWGIVCVVPCAVFYAIIYMLQTFYATTDKRVLSILVSIIPEAIIFPLSLSLCLNLIRGGDNNLFVIWLCLGLNSLLFILVAYIGYIVKNKSLKLNVEKLLIINKMQTNALPIIDISINSLEEVSQLAETIQNFFKQNEVKDRTSMFSALAVDEIATDVMKKGNYKIKKLPDNIPYLDIKIMSQSGSVKIIIRDAGPAYNPLGYDQLIDNTAKFGVKAVQKMANYIQYQRIYQMNIITIDIAK